MEWHSRVRISTRVARDGDSRFGCYFFFEVFLAAGLAAFFVTFFAAAFFTALAVALVEAFFAGAASAVDFALPFPKTKDQFCEYFSEVPTRKIVTAQHPFNCSSYTKRSTLRWFRMCESRKSVKVATEE